MTSLSLESEPIVAHRGIGLLLLWLLLLWLVLLEANLADDAAESLLKITSTLHIVLLK